MACYVLKKRDTVIFSKANNDRFHFLLKHYKTNLKILLSKEKYIWVTKFKIKWFCFQDRTTNAASCLRWRSAVRRTATFIIGRLDSGVPAGQLRLEYNIFLKQFLYNKIINVLLPFHSSSLFPFNWMKKMYVKSKGNF
jgi:hypothetical protein